MRMARLQQLVLLALLLLTAGSCVSRRSTAHAAGMYMLQQPEVTDLPAQQDAQLAAAAASSSSGSDYYYPPVPPTPSQRFCSCANPLPLPLRGGGGLAAAPAGKTAAVGTPSHYGYPNQCKGLPLAGPGEKCGAQIAICKPTFCCGQAGFCSQLASDCDGTCQCAFSGRNSKCKGSFPFPTPLPATLPTALRGGLCSPYVARCPANQCCSQFGYCVDDNTAAGYYYCQIPSCRPGSSPLSSLCRAGKWPSLQRIIKETWVVSWKTLALDGFARPVIVVNGEPFPNLEATVGDRIQITVINRLEEPLSVHWHGMLQFQTNIQDGVAAVTQRPVQPGETYVYNFIAETAGTFWWHSHFKTQYVDGLWGAFTIYAPNITADIGITTSYPVDQTVTLSDWYHEKSSVLLREYLSPASDGNEPTPYTALLNGWGQGYCVVTNNPSGCLYSNISAEASFCDNPKTRLRLVNVGAFAVFNVSIDNHRMIVIAEDGTRVQPLEVGSLQINNGQRYDVLVCQSPRPGFAAPSRDPVWIRATMIDDDFPTPSAWNTSLGVLYFTPQPPTTLPTSTADFKPPALTPSQVGPGTVHPYSLLPYGGVKPPPANKQITLAIDFYDEPKGSDNTTQYAHLNDIALQLSPESPSLLERLSNNPANMPPPINPPNGGLGWHTIEIKSGDVVDVIINNHDTGEHPLHLHGHWFTVMSYAPPGVGDYKGAPLNPTVIRDTVTVNAQSYVVLRFLATNPGVWIFHCHIDWHVAAGLGLIFKEGFPRA